MRGAGALLAGFCGLALVGCAAPSPANDPFEPANRQVFALNQQLDHIFFARTVHHYLMLPDGVRGGIHNVLRNLAAPTIFANDLLQARPVQAGHTAMRFVLNSSIGLGGLLDPATGAGLPYHGEDFGQTLANWGVGEGPYLMLPLLGPSNPRDAAGLAMDTLVLDPTNYLRIKDHFWWDAGRQYFNLLDLRSQSFESLREIERSSVDYYATLRSLYRQNREAEIRNGAPAPAAELPDF